MARSSRLVRRIFACELEPTWQRVLLAIADHANDGTDAGAWPAVGLIAWKVGISERQVQRVMAQMRGCGLLVPTKGARPGRPTTYRIDLEQLPQKPPYAPRKGDAQMSPMKGDVQMSPMTAAPMGDIPAEKGDISGQVGDVQMSPKVSIEVTNEVSPRAREDDDVAIDLALEALANVPEYPLDLEADPRMLRHVHDARPLVNLAGEIDAWRERGRRQSMRDQRAALEAWLRKARDAAPRDRERYCTFDGCWKRGYGARQRCIQHQGIEVAS